MKSKSPENRGGVLADPETVATAPPARPIPEAPMIRLKEILVPVDFTDCTEKALAYAIPFARQFGGSITLLHVIEQAFVPATEFGMVVSVDVSAEARRELEKLQKRVARQVQCGSLLRQGGADYEIVNVAKELDCDLIVLGTHGRTGVDRLLLGSTAEKVVRRAGCPVFIVRPVEHDFISGTESAWEREPTYLEREIEAEMKASM